MKQHCGNDTKITHLLQVRSLELVYHLLLTNVRPRNSV